MSTERPEWMEFEPAYKPWQRRRTVLAVFALIAATLLMAYVLHGIGTGTWSEWHWPLRPTTCEQ